jgi:hypothetical protein
MTKRCFTFLSCEHSSTCQHSVADPENDCIQPKHVGDYCPHYLRIRPDDEIQAKMARKSGDDQ